MRRLAPLAFACVLAATGAGCHPRVAGALLGAAVVTAAVLGTAAVLHHHDEHFHHHRCGHHRRYHEGRWVYHYHGHWEYYDPHTGAWYVYEEY